MKKPFTFYMIWSVYISLLAAMLPHTAWLIRQFEPSQSPVIAFGVTFADFLSYVLAFAFEASIAVFTHKLTETIEGTKRQYKTVNGTRVPDVWATFQARYLNIFTFSLMGSALMSSAANYAHAVQFGIDLAVFNQWTGFKETYSILFGAFLPVLAFVFARALSTVNDTIAEDDPAIVELKNRNSELNKANRELSQKFSVLEKAFSDLKEKFSKAADDLKAAIEALTDRETELKAAKDALNTAKEEVNTLQERLKNTKGIPGDAKEAILYLKQNYPALNNTAISVIAKVSPGYVSQVLKDFTLPLERTAVKNETETDSSI